MGGGLPKRAILGRMYTSPAIRPDAAHRPHGHVSGPGSPRCAQVRDPRTWDGLVAAHPQGNFLQSAAWGRFKAHFSWAAARLCLPDPRGGQPLLTQALFRRIPYSPFTLGYLPRGP